MVLMVVPEIFTKLLGILEPLLKPTILDVVAEVL